MEPAAAPRRAQVFFPSAAALLTELGHEVVEATPAWHEPDLFHTFLEVGRSHLRFTRSGTRRS